MRRVFACFALPFLVSLSWSCKSVTGDHNVEAGSPGAGKNGEKLTGLMGAVDDLCRAINNGHDWNYLRTQALERPKEYYRDVVLHGMMGAGHIAFELYAVPRGEQLIHHFFAKLGANAAGKTATAAMSIATTGLLAFEALKSSCSTAYAAKALTQLFEAKLNEYQVFKKTEDLDIYFCARINSLTEPFAEHPSWCKKNGFALGAKPGVCGRVRATPRGGALVYDNQYFANGLGYLGPNQIVRITERWESPKGAKLLVIKILRASGSFDVQGKVNEAWMLPGYLERVDCPKAD